MLRISRQATLGLVPMTMLFTLGCHREPALPKTFPAIGVVTDSDGAPIKGGSVRFSLAGDPLLQVLGKIQPDGTFKLHTVKENASADGAPEGEYLVIVQPLAEMVEGSDLKFAHRGSSAIALPKTYKVEAKENSFKLEMPEPLP